jgi:hypothetical protein
MYMQAEAQNVEFNKPSSAEEVGFWYFQVEETWNS